MLPWQKVVLCQMFPKPVFSGRGVAFLQAYCWLERVAAIEMLMQTDLDQSLLTNVVWFQRGEVRIAEKQRLNLLQFSQTTPAAEKDSYSRFQKVTKRCQNMPKPSNHQQYNRLKSGGRPDGGCLSFKQMMMMQPKSRKGQPLYLGLYGHVLRGTENVSHSRWWELCVCVFVCICVCVCAFF